MFHQFLKAEQYQKEFFSENRKAFCSLLLDKRKAEKYENRNFVSIIILDGQ